MALSLKPEQLKRYRDIAHLLVKYGRSDVVHDMGLDELAEGEVHDDTEAEAEELAADLERMGPTYIKVGQLLSTRPDLLPPTYLVALARLQDDVEPFDSAVARSTVEEELGVDIDEAFRTFEAEPLAVASLGQVYYAELRDGRPVAVKVLRPGIRARIAEDMDAIETVAELLHRHTDLGRRYDLVGVAREFRQSIARETDYRLEARNLERLRENLSGFRRIVVPAPIDDYTTSKVLTMEYVAGRKITDIGNLDRIALDGDVLADELFAAYLQQTLVDGFFHADPHPGNLLITDDGRISLLDLGMVGQVSSRMQERLLRLLLAISEGKGEETAEVAMGLGEAREGFDRAGFVRAVSELVAQQHGMGLRDLQVGRVVMKVTRVASENGIRVPSELTLLGKTLLNLDEAGRILDPDFDPNEAVQKHVAEIMRKRMIKQVSPGNVFSAALEVNELLQRLPARLNQALDRLSRDELELKVDVFDEVHMMEGLQKIANRITMGLVLAALVVSAAMLMQIETEFTILGYPGFAMLLFLAAVAGGIVLFLDILRHDEKIDRRRRKRG
jgi:ubiquinone biosynthesis protein